MRLSNLLFAGASALLLGLTGCQKPNADVNGGENSTTEGTTYMSINLTNLLPDMEHTRTTDGEDPNYNSKGNWAGRDKINSVAVYIVDNTTGAVTEHLAEPSATPHSVDENGKISKFKAWRTTPGEKTIYVVVNGEVTYRESLAASTIDTIDEVYKTSLEATDANGVKADYAKFQEGKDVILMTGAPVQMTVARGVTKEQAEAGTHNNASLNVRRAVAQAVVTYGDIKGDNTAGTFEIKRGDTKIATIGDLKWSVQQFEKKTPAYVSEKKTELLQTLSFDYIPMNGDYTTTAPTKYAYVNNTAKEKNVKAFSRKKAKNAIPTIMTELLGQNLDEDNAFYLTETTHKFGETKLHKDGGEANKQEPGYRKGNTPYFIISATITPEDNAWANGEKDKAGTDLHLVNGKFYKELSAARTAAQTATPAPPDDAADKVVTYKNAKCYYIYWLNTTPFSTSSKAPKYELNSPIIRNNFYHVNITAFKKFGLTGNPLNPTPENPNKPDPDDPNTPKPDEGLYTPETYMEVDVTIVPMGVHSFDHSF